MLVAFLCRFVSSKPPIHVWVSSIVNIDLEMVGTKGAIIRFLIFVVLVNATELV